jgi:MoaE-MoaD fusion protein
MKIKILLFAHLREIFDTPEIELEFDTETTGTAILNQLEKLKPEISVQKKYLKISVNGEYATLDQTITTGSEVAVFPPVSGG